MTYHMMSYDTSFSKKKTHVLDTDSSYVRKIAVQRWRDWGQQRGCVDGIEAPFLRKIHEALSSSLRLGST